MDRTCNQGCDALTNRLQSMKTFRYIKKYCLRWGMLGLLVAAIISLQAEASGTTAVMIGGGGGYEPIYSGSHEFSETLIPLIDMEYQTTNFDLFLSTINGVGLRMKGDSFAGANAAVGIYFGEERDPGKDAVKKFLTGTPKLTNDFQVFGTVGMDIEPLRISSTIRWFPVTAEYKDSGRSDKKYDSLLAEIALKSLFPLTENLCINAGVGMTWMDEEYARAYYGIEAKTSELREFQARGGMRDIYGSVGMTLMFSQNIGANMTMRASQLLGHAADSPLSKNDFQPQAQAVVFYQF